MQEVRHRLVVDRRTFIAGGVLALTAFTGDAAAAASVIGTVDEVRGSVSRRVSKRRPSPSGFPTNAC